MSTFKAFALTNVEQLLSCRHGRPFHGMVLCRKARPACGGASRRLTYHYACIRPTLHDKHAGVAEKAEPQVEHYLLNGTGTPVQETTRSRAQKTTGARGVRDPVVGVQVKEPSRRP